MTERVFTHVEKGADPVITEGEDILYLILIEGYWTNDDNSETYRTWEFKRGRQEAYDFIKDLVLLEGDDHPDMIIDIDKSLIYADNPHIKNSKLKLSNGISVYRFMKDAYTLHKVKDDDTTFDISEFHQESIDE